MDKAVIFRDSGFSLIGKCYYGPKIDPSSTRSCLSHFLRYLNQRDRDFLIETTMNATTRLVDPNITINTDLASTTIEIDHEPP